MRPVTVLCVDLCAPPSKSDNSAGVLHKGVKQALMTDLGITMRFIFMSSVGINVHETPLDTMTNI